MDINQPQHQNDQSAPFREIDCKTETHPLTITERLLADPDDQELTIYAGLNIAPIQVRVLANLEVGLGDKVVLSLIEKLKKHPQYLFDEGEHSALIFGHSMQDPSAVYQLAVGEEPLTWHRHPACAHRIITVTTGSGGAEARFSFATEEEIDENPQALIEKMVIIELPADAQVLIRFNGVTYHQFGPLKDGHPAFAGISVHKNEGEELREVRGEAGNQGAHGSIPELTHCITEEVKALMAIPSELASVPRIQLNKLLEAPFKPGDMN